MSAAGRPDDCPEVMNVEEAARYLGIGETDWQARVRADLVPHIHVGSGSGRVVQYRSVLDVWKLASAIDAMAHSGVRELMTAALVGQDTPPASERRKR